MTDNLDTNKLDTIYEEVSNLINSAYEDGRHDEKYDNDKPDLNSRAAQFKLFAKQAIEAYIAERVVEAQNNGVAWTISVVDDLHIVDSDHTALGHKQDLDRTYKGIKNTIRDRYKAETGIDPAPSYPIHVVLKSNERVSNE